MKNIKILLFFVFTFWFFSITQASSIEKIDAIDNNTVEITANDDVVFSDTFVEGDIKILKDMKVLYSKKDVTNHRKVLLNLSDDLLVNNSYSLISLLWAEWNIDFKIWDYLEGEIINPMLQEWDKGIEKINIIDSKTIEIYYNYDLVDDLFEFKILSDIPTTWLFSEWNNIVNLWINGNLEKDTDYILMFLRLKDINWNPLVFEENLYDFKTSSDLVEDVEEKDVVLAAAKEETNTWNIEEVALSAEKTPNTGSATWILVLLTIIVNAVFFFRKKIIK